MQFSLNLSLKKKVIETPSIAQKQWVKFKHIITRWQLFLSIMGGRFKFTWMVIANKIVCHQILCVWRPWLECSPTWVDMDLWPIIPLDICATCFLQDVFWIDSYLQGQVHGSASPADQNVSCYSLSLTQASINRAPRGPLGRGGGAYAAKAPCGNAIKGMWWRNESKVQNWEGVIAIEILTSKQEKFLCKPSPMKQRQNPNQNLKFRGAWVA